jgi:hypothetical protein
VPTVRLERDGLFGPVGVVDTAEARRFTIRGVLQGASLLRPAANAVVPSLGQGPGPVTETRYQLAWFVPGQRHPAGRGLMLGLGGGCGVVGLLHQFPDLVMDAVDADPAMVEMAREFHPLVGHYERCGRLRLHVAQASDYLTRSRNSADFVIADLVVDSESLEAIGSQALVGAIAGAAPEAWFRVFGSLPDGELQPILDQFRGAGLPVRWLLSPVNRFVPLPKPRDWILGAGVAFLPDPDDFVPYRELRGSGVAKVQAAYRKLVAGGAPP